MRASKVISHAEWTARKNDPNWNGTNRAIEAIREKVENMADHKHEPMPDELPRGWADDTWDTWVEETGTDPNSRTWTFYREDLSWVYTRVIRPLRSAMAGLQQAMKLLTERVRKLESSGGGSGDVTRAEFDALVVKVDNHINAKTRGPHT